MANEAWIDKAIQRLVDLTDTATGNAFTNTFRGVARIDGAEIKFKRFARASTIDEMGGLNAELTFALMFVGLGFTVVFEPSGDKGPDLSISRDSQLALVEVKRFRNGPDVTTAKRKTTGDSLVFHAYGQPEKDTDKVRSELFKKIRQISGQNGILAVWCDNDEMEFLEHQFAVADMRRDSEADVQRV